MSRVFEARYRLTRTGEVQKHPSEVYLQEELQCLFSCCGKEHPQVEKNSASGRRAYIIPTPECLVECAALIEDGFFNNMILTRTALQELATNRPQAYKKISEYVDRQMIPVVEDRNSKEIQAFVQNTRRDIGYHEKIAIWYGRHRSSCEFVAVYATAEDAQDSETSQRADRYLRANFQRDPLAHPTVSIPQTDTEEIHRKYIDENELMRKTAEGSVEKGVIVVENREIGTGKIQCSISGIQKDVEIPKGKTNRAVNGDTVYVEILSREGPAAVGSVVAVEKRAPRLHVFTIHEKIDAHHSVIKPISPRYPLALARTDGISELNGFLLVGWISTWDACSKYPTGHIVRAIGPEGNIDSEIEAFKVEHGILDRAFEKDAELELPSADWRVSEQEAEDREDFRELPIASIDPEGCTDIDDALHARNLENGNIEIGVHIADVGHFVKQDGFLDREGRIRGCTVYLPNKRIDMLPGLLGNNLCSLHQHRDRLAFSILWEISARDISGRGKTPGDSLEILSRKVVKSVIRSRESLTYEKASEILAAGTYTDKELFSSIRLLKDVSNVLRRKRVENGAFMIHSNECRVTSGGSKSLEELSQSPETHLVREKHLPEEFDTHTLVEEFMLLANHHVAEIITAAYPKESLIRIHPEPAQGSFGKLEAAISSILPENPVRIDPSKSQEISNVLEELGKSQRVRSTLGSLTTRCMTQAIYVPSSSESHYHYGLAMNNYTHFTSPIRRYPDIVVHRMLLSAIRGKKRSPLTRMEIDEICWSVNRSYRRSKIISREITDLFIRSAIVGKEVLLCVTSIEPSRIEVHCPEYGIDGTLVVENTLEVSNKRFKDAKGREYRLLSTLTGVLCDSFKREVVFEMR